MPVATTGKPCTVFRHLPLNMDNLSVVCPSDAGEPNSRWVCIHLVYAIPFLGPHLRFFVIAFLMGLRQSLFSEWVPLPWPRLTQRSLWRKEAHQKCFICGLHGVYFSGFSSSVDPFWLYIWEGTRRVALYSDATVQTLSTLCSSACTQEANRFLHSMWCQRRSAEHHIRRRSRRLVRKLIWLCDN